MTLIRVVLILNIVSVSAFSTAYNAGSRIGRDRSLRTDVMPRNLFIKDMIPPKSFPHTCTKLQAVVGNFGVNNDNFLCSIWKEMS